MHLNTSSGPDLEGIAFNGNLNIFSCLTLNRLNGGYKKPLTFVCDRL